MKIYAYRQYNRMPYPEEVAANYNGQVTRSGLVGEWLMNEGTGTTAHDTSGYGNHGTITGATWAEQQQQRLTSAPTKVKKNMIQATTPNTATASVFPDVTYVLRNYGPVRIVGATSISVYGGKVVQLIAGTPLTCSAMVYNQNPTSITVTGSISGATPGPATTVLPGSWALVSGSYTPNVNNTNGSFRLWESSGQTFHADNFQQEQGSTATAFEPYQLVPDNKAAVQVKPAAR